MELLKIRTDQFEGTLDLMLFLISKNELDISTVSIHKITDQYLQYVEMIREINFDVASDYLVMAATLIHLKSKRLLPDENSIAAQGNDVDEIVSEEELVRRLQEYKRFQGMGRTLGELPRLNSEIFARPNVPEPEKQTIWREMDLTELTLVFQDALKRSRKRTRIIIREPTSIPERITQIGKILKVGEMTEFDSLFTTLTGDIKADKAIVVVTFIALLEIARLKKLRIYQNSNFGTIFLTLTESLDEFDLNMVTGFEYNKKQIQEMNSNINSIIHDQAVHNMPESTL